MFFNEIRFLSSRQIRKLALPNRVRLAVRVADPFARSGRSLGRRLSDELSLANFFPSTGAFRRFERNPLTLAGLAAFQKIFESISPPSPPTESAVLSVLQARKKRACFLSFPFEFGAKKSPVFQMLKSTHKTVFILKQVQSPIIRRVKLP